MREKIYSAMTSLIGQFGHNLYREPIIGITGVNNPSIRRLKDIVHPEHFLPEDILPGARSVVAYFLPFDKHVVKGNQGGRNSSKVWAQTYIETNNLLSRIAERISTEFALEGYRCTWEKPTHNFSADTLVSCWSHKHVAFACGLGRFGRNRLLITDKGCAGRIGSVVTNWEPRGIGVDNEKNPFYNCPQSCNYCIQSCPVGALTEQGLDKDACYGMCLENDGYYPDLGLCDVCGKCSTGPCSFLL